MKIFEFILLVVAVMIWGQALASQFTTVTGQGYFTWNGQVMSYYSFTPNSTFNLVDGVTPTDTNTTPNEVINQAAFNSYICTQNNEQC